jgi:hypothetical protein
MSMMTELSPAERGAQLLDRVMPHWRHMIDLARLDLIDSQDCILGQLWGDFDDGMNALFGKEWTVTDARSCGFDQYEPGGSWRTWSGSLSDWESFYRTLTQHWRVLITGRKEGADDRTGTDPAHDQLGIAGSRP